MGGFRIKSRGVWGDLELKVGGLGDDLREVSGLGDDLKYKRGLGGFKRSKWVGGGFKISKWFWTDLERSIRDCSLLIVIKKCQAKSINILEIKQ
ncbi:MAG TPA: hypothetical protein PLW94_03045 [Candidatus Absconditabacterales bacterium]|nr:hypothetical protein [Candidatus Absconditabacterales bacterium]